MILNCAIVDDEPLALELLKSYVEKTSFLRLVGRYSSAVHHEFSHILHQTIEFPQDFYAVSSGKYIGNGWVNVSDEAALGMGFITAYGGSEVHEDFAELVANYVTHDAAWWQQQLKIADEGATLIDAKGMYIVPGGVEIHVHGGGGRDFMEGTEEAFRAAVAAHMQHGTTSIFPTLSSSTIPMIREAAATTEKLMAEKDSPVLGLHLEGHYFNMKMAGGQLPENIKNPDPEEYIPLLEETHCIKRWDAAPELPGAMQFGKYVTSKGVLASVGHTQAEYEDIQTAYEAGYTHATHFYNAMPGFHKRREYKYEGTVESIYLIDDMTVEVVADGIHVPPTILRLVYKIKGVTAKVSVIWNYTFPKGGGDTHFSVMKGSKADLVIRQGKEQNYQPELFVEAVKGVDLAAYEKDLTASMEKVSAEYPGVKKTASMLIPCT